MTDRSECRRMNCDDVSHCVGTVDNGFWQVSGDGAIREATQRYKFCPDCGRSLKAFWEEFDREDDKKWPKTAVALCEERFALFKLNAKLNVPPKWEGHPAEASSKDKGKSEVP